MPNGLLLLLGTLGAVLWAGLGLGLPWTVPAAYDLILLLAALLDLALVPSAVSLTPKRKCPEHLNRGEILEMELSFSPCVRYTLHLTVRDILPREVAPRSPQVRVTVRPGDGGSGTYTVCPPRRGRFTLGPLYLRVPGPLGLVQRQYRVDSFSSLWVHPRLSLGHRLPAILPQTGGAKRRMLPTLGLEFEGLREHRPDDDLRLVNWKATARRGKLMVNEYRDERSQSIILAVDTGRAMLPAVADGNKLDQALEAALRLADTALLHGDRVGGMAFAEEVTGFLPPRGGREQYRRLLALLGTATAGPAEPDYVAALGFLEQHWRKRSLVVLFTDLVEPDVSARALSALGNIATQHLVLVATLRDPRLDALLAEPPATSTDVYRQATAVRAATEVQAAIHRLTAAGVVAVHAPAADLASAVTGAYLRIKGQARL